MQKSTLYPGAEPADRELHSPFCIQGPPHSLLQSRDTLPFRWQWAWAIEVWKICPRGWGVPSCTNVSEQAHSDTAAITIPRDWHVAVCQWRSGPTSESVKVNHQHYKPLESLGSPKNGSGGGGGGGAEYWGWPFLHGKLYLYGLIPLDHEKYLQVLFLCCCSFQHNSFCWKTQFLQNTIITLHEILILMLHLMYVLYLLYI